jgi:SAM-dependent methyltransferase
MPAACALLLQLAALLSTLLLRQALLSFASIVVSLLLLAFLQGLIAVTLSHYFGLAHWWLPIQLLFPVTTLLVHALHLPPVIFLCGFVFFLLLFWSTFRTQVPFYPSRTATWQAVDALLPQETPLRLIDIGSGLGGFLMSLAERRSQGTFTGIEIAPLPWLISRTRVFCSGNSAKFILGDYVRLDFAEYDVVFAYLSPVAMTTLWAKASAEMRPGSLLLSYEFPIEGVRPDIQVNTSNKGAIIYGWRI